MARSITRENADRVHFVNEILEIESKANKPMPRLHRIIVETILLWSYNIYTSIEV